MGDELARSLADGLGEEDRLFLPDPVYQGGTVDRSRGSEWLADKVRELGRNADHIAERQAIGEALVAEAKDGDRIVVMGARDDSLSEFAAELVERLETSS
jgi:UDP-N-acetylmuramate--alanine ligase